jgi:hypothetical protein
MYTNEKIRETCTLCISRNLEIKVACTGTWGGESLGTNFPKGYSNREVLSRYPIQDELHKFYGGTHRSNEVYIGSIGIADEKRGTAWFSDIVSKRRSGGKSHLLQKLARHYVLGKARNRDGVIIVPLTVQTCFDGNGPVAGHRPPKHSRKSIAIWAGARVQM